MKKLLINKARSESCFDYPFVASRLKMGLTSGANREDIRHESSKTHEATFSKG